MSSKITQFSGVKSDTETATKSFRFSVKVQQKTQKLKSKVLRRLDFGGKIKNGGAHKVGKQLEKQHFPMQNSGFLPQTGKNKEIMLN